MHSLGGGARPDVARRGSARDIITYILPFIVTICACGGQFGHMLPLWLILWSVMLWCIIIV